MSVEDEIKQTEKKLKELQKKQKKEPVTKADLQEMLKKFNDKTNGIPEKPDKKTTIKKTEKKDDTMSQDKKRALAYQLYKDAKSMSIVCLIAIIFPLITIFTTMISEMLAMIVAMLGLIYPCVVFVRMINIQSRAAKKYGWKPLFSIPQQNQNPQQRQNNYNRGEML